MFYLLWVAQYRSCIKQQSKRRSAYLVLTDLKTCWLKKWLTSKKFNVHSKIQKNLCRSWLKTGVNHGPYRRSNSLKNRSHKVRAIEISIRSIKGTNGRIREAAAAGTPLVTVKPSIAYDQRKGQRNPQITMDALRVALRRVDHLEKAMCGVRSQPPPSSAQAFATTVPV